MIIIIIRIRIIIKIKIESCLLKQFPPQIASMADVRSDEEEASALKNLQEDLTFHYPEFSKNDQLYLKDYAKFLQTQTQIISKNSRTIFTIETEQKF